MNYAIINQLKRGRKSGRGMLQKRVLLAVSCVLWIWR